MGSIKSERVEYMSEYVLLEYLFSVSGDDVTSDLILDRLDVVHRKLFTFINGETEDNFTIYHVGHFIHKVTTSISKLKKNKDL